MAAYSSSNWRTRATGPPPTLPAAEPVLSRQARWPEREWQYHEKQRQFRRQQERGPHVDRVASEASRIYVGNMPYTASKADIEKLFANSGFEVVNIDISIDPFTLRNPSYCFVDFTTSEEARTAMQTLSGIDFQGRPLKVKPCVQKRHQADRYRADVPLSNRWSSNHSQHVETGNDRTPNVALTNNILAPMREHRRIYVGNLPKPLDNHTSDLELRDLFRGFDVEAVSKVLSPSEELVHRSKYYAFVDLRNAEEAAKAVKNLDGVRMWGTELVVSVASGRPRKALKAMGRQNLEE